MASTNQTAETDGKNELSEIQLKTLLKVTGMSEDEIRKSYD